MIGSLVAIAIVEFAIARAIGNPFEEARAAADSEVAAEVDAHTAPVGRLAIAGRDNSALAIKTASAAGEAAAAALPVPKTGEETFQTVCGNCHVAGVGGAPRVSDHAAWAPRIGQGKATLYEHALKGFQGKAGFMPAKGGRTDLPDDLVKETVDYIVKKAQ
ncbi:MAG: cytochrome c5 family protein [Proteobacteria bacterium]|nr:cytochrome c5 family protein [Pseudomonadota bacterium]